MTAVPNTKHRRRECNDLEGLITGEFSDATVKCGSKTWKIHKFIVCRRSEWFQKALDGSFKEHDSTIVVIDDFQPGQIEWLLRWLYSYEYEIPVSPAFSANCFIAPAEAFKLADFFLLDQLQDDVVASFWGKLSDDIYGLQVQDHEGVDSSNFNAVGDVLLSEYCQDFFEGVSAAYSSSHDLSRLRSLFVEFGIRARNVMRYSQVYLDGLIQEARFAADIFIKIESTASYAIFSSANAKCQHCRKRVYVDKRYPARPISNRSTVECSECVQPAALN